MKDNEKMILQAEARNAVKDVRNAKTDEEAAEIIGRLMRKHYSEGYNEGHSDGYQSGYDNGYSDGWENGNMGLN